MLLITQLLLFVEVRRMSAGMLGYNVSKLMRGDFSRVLYCLDKQR